MGFIATRLAEVIEGFIIDGEEAHRGSVFRSHVRNRGSVGERKSLGSFAKEFDEFADDFGLTENFSEAQSEVGSGYAFAEASL